MKKSENTEIQFNLANTVVQDIISMTETYDTSVMDAIIHYAEQKGLEVELVGDIIKKNEFLKSKVEIEAEELHFLKKKNRLPL
jgi:hypothetical protein